MTHEHLPPDDLHHRQAVHLGDVAEGVHHPHPLDQLRQKPEQSLDLLTVLVRVKHHVTAPPGRRIGDEVLGRCGRVRRVIFPVLLESDLEVVREFLFGGGALLLDVQQLPVVVQHDHELVGVTQTQVGQNRRVLQVLSSLLIGQKSLRGDDRTLFQPDPQKACESVRDSRPTT